MTLAVDEGFRKITMSEDDILKYSEQPVSRAKVARHYRSWRERHGITDRCDQPTCFFHVEALVWNSLRLPSILDHENGNRFDNRPENLRYLCPNCDSQLQTRGGSNRGRVVQRFSDGFLLKASDELAEYHLILEDEFELSDGVVSESEEMSQVVKPDAV
jgi:hypothetical protein